MARNFREILALLLVLPDALEHVQQNLLLQPAQLRHRHVRALQLKRLT
jgi:hypothetical protein